MNVRFAKMLEGQKAKKTQGISTAMEKVARDETMTKEKTACEVILSMDQPVLVPTEVGQSSLEPAREGVKAMATVEGLASSGSLSRRKRKAITCPEVVSLPVPAPTFYFYLEALIPQ